MSVGQPPPAGPPGLPPQQPPLPPQQPPRSWWNRNWKWVVPVGCLTPLILCGGCITFIFTTVFGTLKSSDVYKESLATVQQDPQVQEALGTPIEPSFLVFGSIAVENASGTAEISYPISGPKGTGVVMASGTKAADAWQIDALEVRIEPGGQSISLIPPASDTGTYAPDVETEQ